MSVFALLALSTLDSACILRRTPKNPPPPAPAATIPEPPKPAVEAKPPEIPPPTVNIEKTPPETPQVIGQPPQLPGPPKPPRNRRARARAATPPPAVETPAPPAPAPPPAVQLAPLLSEADQRAYMASVNDLLGKAERNLATAETRSPNPQQRGLIEQAKRFVAQAQEMRGKDLPAAKSLAERAEIVSREVLAQMK